MIKHKMEIKGVLTYNIEVKTYNGSMIIETYYVDNKVKQGKPDFQTSIYKTEFQF